MRVWNFSIDKSKDPCRIAKQSVLGRNAELCMGMQIALQHFFPANEMIMDHIGMADVIWLPKKYGLPYPLATPKITTHKRH